MKKIFLAAAFLIGSAISAFAACTGPVVMHDFPGTTFNMSVVLAPTGANDCQSNVALPTWAGGTLGAMVAYGTSPGAVLVPGVNAFVTNTLAAGQALPSASSPVVVAFPSLVGNAPFVSGTTAAMTGTTSTSLIPLVTSQRIYVTRVKCNNSSGTATLVQIRDGSAGTILDTLAAGATYGGEQGTGSTPLFWTTAGTALFAQNVTTGASVICTASGYSG